MDILAKLFGGTARVKIMRLFLLNPGGTFENKDIATKSKVHIAMVRKELALLGSIGFVKKRSFFKEVPVDGGKNKGVHKKRVMGWQLRDDFPLLVSVRNLMVNTEPLRRQEIANRIKRGGNIKLVIVSGFFVHNSDSSLDILIVGDNLKKSAIENAVAVIESEVGKELNYAFLNTSDFKYRLSVYDKFIRDILDYPHEKIVDKLGI
ncbi:MAG: hypothetical protein COZ49_01460 [Candidatus Yonathbacteria bacterium CG_4_10_14_3_um_filter_47_65]|uniref:Transcriptional regulator n=2 Tax=Parcubacteria group TaxID=1794811 RepID=A0A2M8DAH3_9BACT|nr:MAG: hypothetical protein AUJ44_04115 [Candidatus Nomurabacteria bacterium CG1_02_47_685]PIP03653.1 MAG: hypothetical protein COX54_02860 [Candidatus Yonathbacteria bacterium CG23_combo_of_CG06-09_8_20_14_all_46_18]PIQ31796.1 MAG: hypothetical protein COW61_03245 [Candidatus Yonathbacteria bacterium CG17_big_fil_post_rev_8_21_14_2_50_46_19]PIX56560.1 MAG: hypothetical protein COZ49_01460 [Candidatus Yonathbacteria bacterium CG_4_10_14_3_um_filter_47_65]PIY57928.1 MAG: hypothetical protein CO